MRSQVHFGCYWRLTSERKLNKRESFFCLPAQDSIPCWVESPEVTNSQTRHNRNYWCGLIRRVPSYPIHTTNRNTHLTPYITLCNHIFTQRIGVPKVTTTLNISIETDNAAFEDNPNEIREVLARIADSVTNGEYVGIIRDSNGNAVGNWIHAG